MLNDVHKPELIDISQIHRMAKPGTDFSERARVVGIGEYCTEDYFPGSDRYGPIMMIPDILPIPVYPPIDFNPKRIPYHNFRFDRVLVRGVSFASCLWKRTD